MSIPPHNHSHHSTPDSWAACPPGAIGEIVRAQIDDQRRAFLKRIAVGSALIFGGATAVALNLDNMPSMPSFVAPIACADVRRHLEAYLEQRITDRRLLRSIRYHLQHCAGCFNTCERMRADAEGSKDCQPQATAVQ